MKRHRIILPAASCAGALAGLALCLAAQEAPPALLAGEPTACCATDSGTGCCPEATGPRCCPGGLGIGCGQKAASPCGQEKGRCCGEAAKPKASCPQKGKGGGCPRPAGPCCTAAPSGCGAGKPGASCCPTGTKTAKAPAKSCCPAAADKLAQATARLKRIGYTDQDVAALPAGAILASAGAGNVVAGARLEPGQTVVDLGCGGGIDCLLAAARVGSRGKVIGVDMSPEALKKARANLRESGLGQVEFRQGRLEKLPLEDASADVAISNCVGIVMRGDARVLSEAARVLKPGGRLVTTGRMKPEYVAKLRAAGFAEVELFGKNIIVATKPQ